ncbi:MAG: gliding motility protein GldN [Bacteroidota bacterium]|nr:gliding motility protein GldN [Bacteroidota bacterium]
MKKYWIVLLLISVSFFYNYVGAQEKQMPFFEKNGTVAIQTTALNSLADTIAVVNHRADDIVWSRIVYRIVDMRDKQNYQLYFPVVPNEQYRSLFRVILDAAIKDSLKAYEKVERDIQPLFKNVLPKDSLKNYFQICEKDTVNNNIRKTPLIVGDSITQQPTISSYAYKDYVKNQLKFLLQEIVFFDKHTSRMYSKIIAIAPLYALTETNVTLGSTVDTWSYFQSSVLCWFLFDELRPYLARQYVIPSGNDTQRLTYDEYFAQKLYSDYILGDSNLNNRMLLQYLVDPAKIKKEQKRIETELLNFEQDLWEY